MTTPHAQGTPYFNLILWFLDETHIVVTALTALTFLWTRSAHVAYFITGALATNITAKCLKNLLRHSRPVTTTSPVRDLNPSAIPPDRPSHMDRRLKAQVKINREKTFGMPSTHSTSITFFMAYIMMALVAPSGPSFLQRHKTLLASGAMVWGSAILASRVYLGYHTVPQVVVGALLGTSSGIVWKAAWEMSVKRNAEGAAQKMIDEGFRYLKM